MNYQKTIDKYEGLMRDGNQLNRRSFDNLVFELNGDKKINELVSMYRHEEINNTGIKNFLEAVKEKYVN
jgi:hypothetical protein